jgi:hydrogenase maturation protease
MTPPAASVLVIGYGNPGRLDDGLGPALAEALRPRHLPGVTVESDYQLCVEHAPLIAAHRAVVFADAAVAGPAPFAFRRVAPRPAARFTTHLVEPPDLLALAANLFAAEAAGYILAIRGQAFGRFGERLSAAARRNLAAAVEFLGSILQHPERLPSAADPPAEMKDLPA